MTHSPRTAFTRLCLRPYLRLFLALIFAALPVVAAAQQENRLRRIRIVPHPTFTRVNLFFQSPPDYTLRSSTDRVRIEVRGADAPSFKKFRSYSDRRLSGLFTRSRDGIVTVTMPLREAQAGVQVLPSADPAVLSLDIGAGVKRTRQVDIAPDRAPILAGTENFVRDFPAGGVAASPFTPTDGKILKSLMTEGEIALFQQGESLLYREQGNEALAVFTNFANHADPKVRALARYRLGCVLSLLGRGKEAVDSFRQGEALWGGYLDGAPELLQSYAEALVKTGDYAAGRALLLRLMTAALGTPYQAQLMNRLAEMAEHQGAKEAADAMYRSVVVHAPGSAAAGRARLKLADRELFTVSRDRYKELYAKYQAIYQAPGDFSLRDEALFKSALLLALYAPAKEALEASVSYDRRYPRGIFSTIVKKMREELLLPVYRETADAKDDPSLIRLAQENKEHLARCFSDPDFAMRLSGAFERSGRLSEEIELFGYLGDKNWAAAAAPFMLSRKVDDAMALGREALAESAGRDFLARYPRDPRAGRVREQLGRVAFEKGDLEGAGNELRFLEAKGAKPELSDSDYYLAKALEKRGDLRGAVRVMARFTVGAKSTSPLLLDGYFTLAGGLASLKDYDGALAACRLGAKLATGEAAVQFQYKMGELHLLQGGVRSAKEHWEKAAKGGGTWGKLASEALKDLNWRTEISRRLP